MRLGGTAKPGPRSQDSFEGQLNKKSEQELGRGLLNDSSSLEITVCGEWEPGPLRAVRVQPVWLGSRVCTCEEGRAGWSNETGKVSPAPRCFRPAHRGQGSGLSESQEAPWEVPGGACVEHFGILAGWRMDLRGQTLGMGWGRLRRLLSGPGREEVAADSCRGVSEWNCWGWGFIPNGRERGKGCGRPRWLVWVAVGSRKEEWVGRKGGSSRWNVTMPLPRMLGIWFRAQDLL